MVVLVCAAMLILVALLFSAERTALARRTLGVTVLLAVSSYLGYTLI